MTELITLSDTCMKYFIIAQHYTFPTLHCHSQTCPVLACSDTKQIILQLHFALQ